MTRLPVVAIIDDKCDKYLKAKKAKGVSKSFVVREAILHMIAEETKEVRAND